jgi:hypothetical protein
MYNMSHTVIYRVTKCEIDLPTMLYDCRSEVD